MMRLRLLQQRQQLRLRSRSRVKTITHALKQRRSSHANGARGGRENETHCHSLYRTVTIPESRRRRDHNDKEVRVPKAKGGPGPTRTPVPPCPPSPAPLPGPWAPLSSVRPTPPGPCGALGALGALWTLKGSVFLAHRPYRSTLPHGRSKPPPRCPSTTRAHESCWRPVAVQLAGLGHLSHTVAAILDDTSPEPVRSNENDFRGHA